MEAAMYCPKCGSKAIDGQRFCKACGTNLELVSDALEGGEDTLGQLRIDIEALKTGAMNFGKNFRPMHAEQIHSSIKEKSERLPKPKEWLSYSRQHNLKNGLISLFGGAGFGVVLYYLSEVAINEGMIRSIEEAAEGHIHGLEPMARLIWLFALIPVLKGLAQIIYGALFAESIATLSERFMPKQPTQPAQPVSTAPITGGLGEPPPSVTENTTKFFDPATSGGQGSMVGGQGRGESA
jgi:zinc-ribbon domain